MIDRDRKQRGPASPQTLLDRPHGPPLTSPAPFPSGSTEGTHRAAAPADRVGFTKPLHRAEFRALWLADAQSSVGDQLSRVALAVVVYHRTNSAFATALLYSITFLPALFGSVLLGSLADRWPRKDVLVACNLGRAALIAGVSLPGLATPYVFGLVSAATLLGAPFDAANSALLADVFDDDPDVYATASALRTITRQLAQLAGFGVGGALLLAVDPATCLRVDSVTFGISALVIATSLRARRAPAAEHGIAESYWRGMAAGLRTIGSAADLRALMGLTWLVGAFVIPEGLAVPYAAHLGVGPLALGLLMAACPAGQAIGMVVFKRSLTSEGCRALIGPLAIGAGVPLVACAASPGLAASVALWFVSGACTAYLAQAMPEFVIRTPVPRRGQAIGVAASGLTAVQGLGILLGGALTSVTSVTSTVALGGLLGSLLALPLALSWSRQRSVDRPGLVPV